MRVITFGTFDLFHYGHLRILERSKKFGDHLIVGVSTDELNLNKKNEYPAYSQLHRLEIVKAIKYVDEAFYEESLELKRHYIEQFKADILIMGDDWQGKFDYLNDVCQVKYLKRTDNISSAGIKHHISQNHKA